MQAPLEKINFAPIGQTRWTPTIICVFDWPSANKNLQFWCHYVNTAKALQEWCLEILLQKQSDKKYGCYIYGLIATFNNISVMSWWQVLLVNVTEVPVENLRPVGSNWRTWSHNDVSSTPRHARALNSLL